MYANASNNDPSHTRINCSLYEESTPRMNHEKIMKGKCNQFIRCLVVI